ncbi:MAG: hypothetical protein ACMUIE_04005 [Thermoplasmatota archaeon]
MDENGDKGQVCVLCGKKMVFGEFSIKMNPFWVKTFEGWYCPDHPPTEAPKVPA